MAKLLGVVCWLAAGGVGLLVFMVPASQGVSASTDAVEDRVWVAVGLGLLSLLLATVGTVAYIVGESAQKGPTSSDDAS